MNTDSIGVGPGMAVIPFASHHRSWYEQYWDVIYMSSTQFAYTYVYFFFFAVGLRVPFSTNAPARVMQY